MTIRLLSAALVAGFLAACVASGLQFALTSPLILEAEKYETHASLEPVQASSLIVLAHAGSEHGAGHGAGAETEEWQPAPGLPRLAFTALATLVSGVGYALLLGAVLLATGRPVTRGEALRFAIGGFLAASLAPAIGLPPELPGMGGEALALRQTWWIATALATAAGLYLVAIRGGALAVATGLALIVAPHVWGAPHVAESSALPAAVAAQFAARSIAVAFAFWAVLGLAFGWAWDAVARKPAA
ncbi:CbtA family protein [Methylobacterium nodulans]|uniref:Cobalt transporter, subunit CbtA n=1 Tax=Methylobacterium nodulans (strain LMG 21967 / CNCM I-2342 / ORS 2060) TaxID=460265 RepID=B8IUR1_METNO|nr:CbtA family protein [Methylobacterium nodulans]ACL57129.1 cobalt transporter, subunit CbtA [Methylobacterium nodulans ORS 2060]